MSGTTQMLPNNGSSFIDSGKTLSQQRFDLLRARVIRAEVNHLYETYKNLLGVAARIIKNPKEDGLTDIH